MSEIDFSAWEAPPPPDGLADGVVARMAEPEPLPEPAPRRRWVIAATAAAVLAIAGGIWAITRPGRSAPDHGEVVADKPQHLELGGVSADLDRGADIRWQRTSHGFEIEQRAGAASWHMAKDEHMTIGATVASIDAAGASLRVEVPMNLSDAKVIGASAVTAATVAMLTVVVYEGHVKVASSGQTVVVQPGTTYTVKPAPVVLATVPSDKPRIAVLGLGATRDEMPVAKELTDGLRARIRTGAFPFALAPASDKELTDEELLHDCTSEQPACMTAIAGELGADILLYGHVDKQDPGFEVVVKRFSVAEAAVESQDIEMIPPGDASGAALQAWASKIANALLASPTPPKHTGCDAEALIAEGNEQLSAGKHIAALAKYEAAIACKPEERTERLAFMAACNAANVTKARDHWGKLSSASQNQVLQMCVRNGITKDQLDPCDVDAFTQKGMDAEAKGQHGWAIAQFEQAIRCQPSERLYQLAFMTSCNAKILSKAKLYWAKIPPASAQSLKQICMRNGITEDMLDGGPAAPPPADGQGRMRIESIPAADILLDTKPVGHTPVLITTTPGKHRVTFVIGADRYTYPVNVKAGETETLSKDLQ